MTLCKLHSLYELASGSDENDELNKQRLDVFYNLPAREELFNEVHRICDIEIPLRSLEEADVEGLSERDRELRACAIDYYRVHALAAVFGVYEGMPEFEKWLECEAPG